MKPHTAADQQTRAHAWVQNFHDEDNTLLQGIGQNFQYLLDHVDAFESGDLSYTDLPEFNKANRWVQWYCTIFGTRWPPATPSVHVVLDDDGRLIGVFGHEENATDRADEENYHVREVLPETRETETHLDLARENGEMMTAVAENLTALEDDLYALQNPEDLPRLDENVRTLIVYSVMFGTLWELSHPALYAVLGVDDQFHGLYADPEDAEAAAEDDPDWVTQRISVIDGDLPPEDILEMPQD